MDVFQTQDGESNMMRFRGIQIIGCVLFCFSVNVIHSNAKEVGLVCHGKYNLGNSSISYSTTLTIQMNPEKKKVIPDGPSYKIVREKFSNRKIFYDEDEKLGNSTINRKVTINRYTGQAMIVSITLNKQGYIIGNWFFIGFCSIGKRKF